jgi:hypothetical protein
VAQKSSLNTKNIFLDIFLQDFFIGDGVKEK